MKILNCLFIMLLSGCIWNNNQNNNQNNIIQNTGTGKAQVVIVGVENGFAGKCIGTLKDTADMSKLLQPYATNIVVLTDKAATSSNVISAFENAVNSDFSIFYFSGHGGSSSTSDKFEIDGRDEYICCYDKGVPDNKIWDIICKSKGRVFLIFDCCHSETMFRTPGILFKSILTKTSRNATQQNMLCWSGCPDNSYSYGTEFGGEFTQTLLNYMDQKSTYDEIWKKLQNDKRLKSQQIIKQTKIGNFNTDKTKIFE